MRGFLRWVGGRQVGGPRVASVYANLGQSHDSKLLSPPHCKHLIHNQEHQPSSSSRLIAGGDRTSQRFSAKF